MNLHLSKSSPKNEVNKTKDQEKPQKVPKETPRVASSKISERLNKVIEETSPLDKNRSSDLVPLSAEYERMKHQLRALVTVVKNYKKTTDDMNDAKFELAKHLSVFSERSPIYDEVGNVMDQETAAALKKIYLRSKPHPTTEEVTQLKEEFKKQQGTDILSLYGLSSIAFAQSVANDTEFQEHVLDYVVDWDRIVTERVDAALKHVKELESTRRHYEQKVTGLREKTNHMEEKGKEPSKSQSEKLDRNEDKLKNAFREHEREAGKVCALIEAVTHEGYKDLYPLVKNYMKWEMNRIGRDHDIAERMSEILESLNEKMGTSKTRPQKVEEQSYEGGDEPVDSTAEQ